MNKPVTGARGPGTIPYKLALRWITSLGHKGLEIGVRKTHPERLAIVFDLPVIEHLIDQVLISGLVGNIDMKRNAARLQHPPDLRDRNFEDVRCAFMSPNR